MSCLNDVHVRAPGLDGASCESSQASSQSAGADAADNALKIIRWVYRVVGTQGEGEGLVGVELGCGNIRDEGAEVNGIERKAGRGEMELGGHFGGVKRYNFDCRAFVVAVTTFFVSISFCCCVEQVDCSPRSAVARQLRRDY